MRRRLFSCQAGDVVLPERRLVLVGRQDGGNLVVMPPREVWDRGALTPIELTRWSWLVAATGTAMLETLPQLEGGCINYWDAGNWALNDAADPPGVRKTGPAHRKLHLHLLGRSRSAASPSFAWGEAPKFPDFRHRFEWAASHERLTPEECRNLVARVAALLEGRYEMPARDIAPWGLCGVCRYPMPLTGGAPETVCGECREDQGS